MNRLNAVEKLAISFCLVAALIGCGQQSAAPEAKTAEPPKTEATAESPQEKRIAEGLAKLSAEDRPLAEAQKFCAVENKNRLGEMGEPYKVMIEGQPVFLCCDGCKDEALKDPKATLAKVEELKKANAAK
jgi:hypothetical protein